MIAYLFASLLLPLFARALKENEDVFPLLRLAFKILFSGAFILAMTCLLFDIEILGLRFHSELDLAAPVFSVLMFSFLAVCMSYIFGTLLTAKGSMKWLNIIALACTLLNLLLNAWLIPTHMAYGSALASLISQAMMAIAQIVAVFIIFKPEWQKSFSISFISFLAGVLVLAWSISHLNYHWQILSLIFVGGSVLIGLLSGMLSIKKFILIMRS
jgi:O-antigen/teichoic acid export membrane protein